MDPEVQRRFDQKHANAIAKEYDPELFGLGTVSLRADGKYYAIDAQHRIAAALLAERGDVRVLFKVYRSLTPSEEAAKFRELNGHKKSVQALDDFRLAVTAGHPVFCDVNRIVESFGLRVAPHKREGGISAVTALLLIYQGKIGGKAAVSQVPANGLPKGQLLSRTLHILVTAWKKDRDAFDGVLLRGVAATVHKHGLSVDAQTFARKLAKSGTAAQAIGSIRGLQTLARKAPLVASIEWLEGVYTRGHGRARKLVTGT